MYFVASVVVVYDPKVNGQRIYRGHRYRVTCVEKIKMGEVGGTGKETIVELIASAESAYEPSIKIWHPMTLETIRTIPTVHTYGIVHLHATDKTILSYGISTKTAQTYSLQLSSTRTGQKIASR